MRESEVFRMASIAKAFYKAWKKLYSNTNIGSSSTQTMLNI